MKLRPTLLMMCSSILLGYMAGLPVTWAAPPPSQPALVQPVSENAMLRAWLNCEECREGQLGRVVEQGNDIVPELAQVAELAGKYLASDSLVALEGFQLKFQATQARESYAALVAMDPAFGERVGQEYFVETQLRRQLLRYQSRSLLALRQIGTPQAMAIYDELSPGQDTP